MTDDLGPEIERSLDRLFSYPSVSHFSRNFHQLTWRLGRESGGREFQRLFLRYLELETWHHRLGQQVQEGLTFRRAELEDLEEKRQISLRSLLEEAQQLLTATADSEIPRLLLLAELYYQLGDSKGVIGQLRSLLERGFSHPLVCFALGRNHFMHAMGEFTVDGSAPGVRVVRDPAGFMGECSQAAQAFKRGLTGDTFDAELYWWMGLVAEARHELREAVVSYQRAADIDPTTFDEPVREKLEFLRQVGASPGKGLLRLTEDRGQITQEELNEVARWLMGRFRPQEIDPEAGGG